jgi:cytochrome b561
VVVSERGRLMSKATAATVEIYDARTILLHWLTAGLVVLQWVGAHYIDAFPSGPLRVDARSVHIVVGLALVAVFLARIAWRRSGGRVLAPFASAPVRLASKAMHGLLYLVLAAVLVAGVANAWERGDHIFGLFQIPSFAPGDKGLRSLIGTSHEWFANALLIAAGLHALAGIAHSVALKDGVLARMLPWARAKARLVQAESPEPMKVL